MQGIGNNAIRNPRRDVEELEEEDRVPRGHNPHFGVVRVERYGGYGHIADQPADREVHGPYQSTPAERVDIAYRQVRNFMTDPQIVEWDTMSKLKIGGAIFGILVLIIGAIWTRILLDEDQD